MRDGQLCAQVFFFNGNTTWQKKVKITEKGFKWIKWNCY